MGRTFVGMTGASGHLYAEVLVRRLVALGREVDLAITDAGSKVLAHERGIQSGANGELSDVALADWLGPEAVGRVYVWRRDAVEAPPSSGTHMTGGTVLIPCSMGTLARVSAGFSSNLVERAADVALKEGRNLILVPRETPLSEIHLENMLRLARLGAVILPAMPGFYHQPQSVEDLVEHVVGKVLDRLGIDRDDAVRWSGLEPSPERGTERPSTGPGTERPATSRGTDPTPAQERRPS